MTGHRSSASCSGASSARSACTTQLRRGPARARRRPGFAEGQDFTVQNTSWAGASGSLVSTARDLGRFYRALARGRLLAPAQLAAMQTCDPAAQGYGLGLYPITTSCGEAWGHNGAVPGYYAQAYASEDGRRRGRVLVNLQPLSSARRPRSSARSSRRIAREERGANPPDRGEAVPAGSSPRRWRSRARRSTRSRRSATRRRCRWRSRWRGISGNPWKRCSMQTRDITRSRWWMPGVRAVHRRAHVRRVRDRRRRRPEARSRSGSWPSSAALFRSGAAARRCAGIGGPERDERWEMIDLRAVRLHRHRADRLHHRRAGCTRSRAARTAARTR